MPVGTLGKTRATKATRLWTPKFAAGVCEPALRVARGLRAPGPMKDPRIGTVLRVVAKWGRRSVEDGTSGVVTAGVALSRGMSGGNILVPGKLGLRDGTGSWAGRYVLAAGLVAAWEVVENVAGLVIVVRGNGRFPEEDWGVRAVCHFHCARPLGPRDAHLRAHSPRDSRRPS